MFAMVRAHLTWVHYAFDCARVPPWPLRGAHLVAQVRAAGIQVALLQDLLILRHACGCRAQDDQSSSVSSRMAAS